MRSLRPISGASTEIEICAALRLILDSAWFSKSPKLAAFLTFVVGEALAGNADRIKGYTIAVDALGADGSRSDSAHRLPKSSDGRGA